MNLNTMSAVMTFVSKIENDSASFYDKTVKKYPEFEETFQAWIRENAKFEKQVKQTYFGVITDTLESNFPLEDWTAVTMTSIWSCRRMRVSQKGKKRTFVNRRDYQALLSGGGPVVGWFDGRYSEAL